MLTVQCFPWIQHLPWIFFLASGGTIDANAIPRLNTALNGNEMIAGNSGGLVRLLAERVSIQTRCEVIEVIRHDEIRKQLMM